MCQCFRFNYSQLISYQFLFCINLKLLIQYLCTKIIFIMSQYLNQFTPLSGSRPAQQGLQHYQIQIRKLQQKLKQVTNDYEKRIKELESEIKNHRKPVFQNATQSKPTVDLNFQIYQRDNIIKQLKNENIKLRQAINNPDHILIKKNNNFEILTEKDNEINRLKKALIDIESKYDGQFFNEHKVKKQYEMLYKQNEALKLHIRNLQSQKSNNQENLMSKDVLQSINYKKQLQAAHKENQVLKKLIMEQDQSVKNYSRLSQKQFQQSNGRKSAFLGMNTQIEEMKLVVEEYKAKNKQLNQKVIQLSTQNEKLHEEKQKMNRFLSRESKKFQKPRISKVEQDDLIKYMQGKQALRASFIDQPKNVDDTARKHGKYSELGLDQEYMNRISRM